MKDPNKVKMGKKSRAAGKRFELAVQKDLESRGSIVAKWTKNVDLGKKELVNNKPKFNPFTKGLMMNSGGFPDFIVYRESMLDGWKGYFQIYGVECKMNGKLDKLEKDKCRWLLDNSVFGKIRIAQKGDKRGEINYVEFK